VVLESIDRRKRDEPDGKKAALEGALSVSMAVTASTATSLIVFLPLIVGKKSDLTTWLGEVGVTICLALVCSLFSSLTLIPLMSSRFLKPGTVTLGDVATFEIVERPQEIRRQDRKVRVGVRATYEGEGWQEVREQVEGMMNAFDLPGGYSWSWCIW